MMKLPKKYNRARTIFGIIFLISIAIFLFFYSLNWGSSPPGMTSEDLIEIVATFIGTLASCVTAIIGFLGFIFTTAIGWRKEMRDADKAALEREKLRLEIEKQRRELDNNES